MRRYLGKTLASVAALAALVVLLFPLYAVIIGSFETNSQLIAASHYNFFPPSWTLANYTAVLSAQGGHVLSSLVIGLGTTILTLVISLPAAHALARYRFRVTGLLVGGRGGRGTRALSCHRHLSAVLLRTGPARAPGSRSGRRG